MRLEIAAASAPAHPQVGEAVMWVGGAWQRLNANFFRAGDRKVIALTRSTGTVRAAHRRLQTTVGDAVARGRGVFLYETFGNQNFRRHPRPARAAEPADPAQAVGAVCRFRPVPPAAY